MHYLKRIQRYLLKRNNPLKYVRKIGVTVGEHCKMIGSPDFGSEPWLISIGDHTEISCQVVFITHDGATWVFRNADVYKNTLKFGRIRIGSNCFIGARSTILPGVTIGDNCIVGACSLVNKNIPAGEVWGGVPARFIMTTKEYADKCKRNTPAYNFENYKRNFREEVNLICDKVEKRNAGLGRQEHED